MHPGANEPQHPPHATVPLACTTPGQLLRALLRPRLVLPPRCVRSVQLHLVLSGQPHAQPLELHLKPAGRQAREKKTGGWAGEERFIAPNMHCDCQLDISPLPGLHA